jgi:hypothetical protein
MANQAYALCWCGERATWSMFPSPGVTVFLCAAHAPKYQVTLIQEAEYGPAKSS